MSTKLFLTNTASTFNAGDTAALLLNATRGTSSLNAITKTVASGGNPWIDVTETSGGTEVFWVYQVNACTISGSISYNIRGKESSASANAGMALEVDRFDSSGNWISEVGDSGSPGSEYTTTDAAKAGSITPTSTTFNDGDYIGVSLFISNAGGTMGGSTYTVTNTYNGPTNNAAGDSYVTFTEAITAYTPPVVPGSTPTIVASGLTDNGGTTVTGLLTGDLLLCSCYVEPSQEGNSGATYGTVSPPTGFTLGPAPFPVASNDANLTSANTQRNYLAYLWITTAGSQFVGDFASTVTSPAPYYEANGYIVIRGATDSMGGTTGGPWQEIATGGTNGSTTFPAVSLTCAGPNNLLLFLGTDWSSQQGTLAGWSTTARNAGTATTLTANQSAPGSTGSIYPDLPGNGVGIMTSALMSFRNVVQATVLAPTIVPGQVATGTWDGSSTTISASLPNPPTAGNTVLAFVCSDDTYTINGSPTQRFHYLNDVQWDVWEYSSGTLPQTVTATPSTEPGDFTSVVIVEMANGVYDAIGSMASDTSSLGFAIGSVTTTAANDLVFAVVELHAYSQVTPPAGFAFDNGFTVVDSAINVPVGTQDNIAVAMSVASNTFATPGAVGTTSPSWTTTRGINSRGIQIAYKPVSEDGEGGSGGGGSPMSWLTF